MHPRLHSACHPDMLANATAGWPNSVLTELGHELALQNLIT